MILSSCKRLLKLLIRILMES